MATTKERALETLDRMKQIVKNDMLTRHEYLSEEPVNLALREAGAVCRGHKACAIGSLFLAAGVRPEKISTYRGVRWQLAGVYEPSEYAKRRPVLRLALDALDEVAAEWIERDSDIQRSIKRREAGGFDNAIERLFEGAYGTKALDRSSMLRIINTAMGRIRKAA